MREGMSRDHLLTGRRTVTLAGEPDIGKTDREIGEEFFISVRTVGNHVNNILNMANLTSRTEAAAYAIGYCLAVDPGAAD